MSVLFWLLAALVSEGQSPTMMPLDRARVHRPAKSADRRAFQRLGEAVVIVTDPPKEMAGLAEAFAKAKSDKAPAFRVKPPVAVLATGPGLDSPDRVVPRRLARKGQEVTLEIVHTAVRTQGVRLRRNIRWRPMVEVPLDLPAGSYTLEVAWRAVDRLPDGKPLKTPPVTRTVRFEVLPAE
ncbi:MAG: hypothetical protein ACYS5V_15690 [Planctomycetota bacterium]